MGWSLSTSWQGLEKGFPDPSSLWVMLLPTVLQLDPNDLQSPRVCSTGQSEAWRARTEASTLGSQAEPRSYVSRSLEAEKQA